MDNKIIEVEFYVETQTNLGKLPLMEIKDILIREQCIGQEYLEQFVGGIVGTYLKQLS